MSTTSTGKGRCDRCGALGDNPGLAFFITVVDFDAKSGQAITLHYCREQVEDGKNCAKKLQTAMKKV